MWEDPIVKEIRAAGAKLLAASDGDLTKLAGRLRANQKTHPKRVVGKDRIRQTKTKIP